MVESTAANYFHFANRIREVLKLMSIAISTQHARYADVEHTSQEYSLLCIDLPVLASLYTLVLGTCYVSQLYSSSVYLVRPHNIVNSYFSHSIQCFKTMFSGYHTFLTNIIDTEV